MVACPRDNIINAVKNYMSQILKSLVGFSCKATFVTYGWNGSTDNVRL